MIVEDLFKTQRTNLLILLLLFFGCELIIFPVDAFALNDDWSYTYSVKHLHYTGAIDLGYWPAMSLVAHILWGDLFVEVFGFSHFVLRCSTLALSLLTLAVLYRLICRLCGQHHKAFLFTAFLLFNPLYFLWSNTFMTDVPFLCSVVLSFYCAEKILIQQKYSYVIYFSLVCIYSILIRQFGLVLSLSFFTMFPVLLFSAKYKWKAALLCTIPIAVSILTFILFEKWVVHHLPPGATYQSGSATSSSLPEVLSSLVTILPLRFSEIMLYLGLFLCPFAILISLKFIKELKFKDYLLVIPLYGILVYASIAHLAQFPIGNSLYNCGLGVETVYDIQILNINTSHSFSSIFPIIVSGLALSGALALCFVLSVVIVRLIGRMICKSRVNAFKLFLLGFSLVYFMVLCMAKSFFDRYSLPLLLPGIILMMSYYAPSRIANYVVIIYLILMGCFTLLATQDYFNWNRARYTTIDYGIKKGINPSDINGGFEYVAGTFYNEPWWGLWTGEAPFIVTFGPLKNYKMVHYTTYSRYIPLKTDTVFLYRKE